MILIQQRALFYNNNRMFSVVKKFINQKTFSSMMNENDIKKSVFLSQSKDIYTNLALEEWLLKNFNLNQHHILLIWQNNPCVVIGKNQNPWSEINFNAADDKNDDLLIIKENNNINLARRSCTDNAGNAFYHDNGSLNMSFLSPKKRFNSNLNAAMISRSIFREFDCPIDIDVDNNLLLRKNKLLTNNAAKFDVDNSYHNVSLMVKTNKVNRNEALEKNHNVHFNTTNYNNNNNKSICSKLKMMNLCEENPTITVPSLIKAIGWEFLRTKALTLKDGGMELANSQKGFHKINPTENWFPGLNEIRDKFSSWDWCYGQTPKFNITRTFSVPFDLLQPQHTTNNNTGTATASLDITIIVENGKIADITLFTPYEFNTIGFTGEAQVIHNLKGKKFSIQVFDELKSSFDHLLTEKDRFLTHCVRQVMTNT